MSDRDLVIDKVTEEWFITQLRRVGLQDAPKRAYQAWIGPDAPEDAWEQVTETGRLVWYRVVMAVFGIRIPESYEDPIHLR